MRNKRLWVIGFGVWVMASMTFAQQPVLTLDSCLASARQYNCSIRSSQLDVVIAREMKKQMVWKYFPQAGINAFVFGAATPLVDIDVTNASMSGGLGTFLSDVFQAFANLGDSIGTDIKMIRWGASAQLQAVQPIYWGGQIVTANKLARLGIDVAQLKQEVSERDVLQEVTETYWLVAGLMEKRATVHKAGELLDSIGRLAHNAYNHGLATNSDILRVQLKQNELQTQSFQLENGIQLASRLLAHLSGLVYNGEMLLEPLPSEDTIPVDMPKPHFAIEGRPEALLLERNVQYNKLMKRLTLGESLPHLALGASGGYSNIFEHHKLNAVGFIYLTVPLTGWGETSHKLKQHNYQIQQAQWMMEDYRAKLDLQNRQVFDKLAESLKLLKQHRSGRELAQENYRIAMMNYRAGIGTMTELMEAETLLLQAENAFTDARITYLTTLRKFTNLNK